MVFAPAALVFLFAVAAHAQMADSGPVTISGQNGTLIQGLHITNPSGACVTITNSTNITVRASEIGPCAGNAVGISGGSGNSVLDNYIHPDAVPHAGCCDTHDGIFATNTANLRIEGNVIAHGEANIEAQGMNGVSVAGNFLLNPADSDPSVPAEKQSRGQNFQCYSGCSNVTVQNNYALSSTNPIYGLAENQEDSINFGITNTILATGNYIVGGHSPSGCGLIADDRANSAQFTNNVLVDNGQCGISISDGTNQIVSGNQIWERVPISGGGNTAISVWKQYSAACGPVSVINNAASAKTSGGAWNSYWDGGGCAPVTLSGNTFDAAAAARPIPPPPAIPPGPVNCVAASPYSTNTTLASCASSAPRPNPPTNLRATVK